MRAAIFMVALTLSGCARLAGCPLPALPGKFNCKVDMKAGTYQGDEGCKKILRAYDAARMSK